MTAKLVKSKKTRTRWAFSAANANDAAAVAELRAFLAEIEAVQERFAEPLQETFTRHGGLKLSSEQLREYRSLANKIMGKLDLYVLTNDGERARFQTRQDRHDQSCMIYKSTAGGARGSGAPPETIPHGIILSR